jgi:hypothetical protein
MSNRNVDTAASFFYGSLFFCFFLLIADVRVVVGQGRATPSPSAGPGPQCLYVADLLLTNSDYSFSTDGRLLLYDGAGEPMTNVSSVPTAVAVDRQREVLYVASLNSVQGYALPPQSRPLCHRAF